MLDMLPERRTTEGVEATLHLAACHHPLNTGARTAAFATRTA